MFTTIPGTNSRLKTVALSVLAMLYVVGCEDSGSSGSQSRQHTFDINAYPLNKVVCDPIGGGEGAMPKKGIKSELYYKTQNQSRYYKAQDYIDFTTKADQNIFFTDMFVPTRMFSEGFSTQTGQVLKNDAGQKLIEYFGLKMNTNIRLAEEDEEGIYEFALLSDDGSVMKVKNGSTWTEFINNDGDHPTRLGCSSQKITMKRETKLQTEVLYYQGPRYHISNVLLWRKLSSAEAPAGQDQSCGLTGNETWFNPNNNSAPTQNFQSLLGRGWKVLKPNNFYLPDESTEQTQYNPCTEGQNPMISNFRVAEVVSTGVFVSWNTDIPATAQLLIINKATGQTILTPTDNVLRTAHNIQYLSLSSGTTYQVQAISVAEDLGRVVSAPLEFTTP